MGFCLTALHTAVAQHPAPFIFNSDQGSQFTCLAYERALLTAGCRISRDGRGRATDNAFIERLWRSVKWECVYLNPATDGQHLYQQLHTYFCYYNHHPNLDTAQVEALITPHTRAIVPVHHAGAACDMATLLASARKHDLFVVEDAAQAIGGTYQDRPLGSIGHLAAFSFHETKNIIAGKGGLLAINDARFATRALILWEKGTNRAAFSRGEVARYQWVDIGSSYLPSELMAAYLWGQLQELATIQERRFQQWQHYYHALQELQRAGCFALPWLPNYGRHNAHIFYLLCRTQPERDALIQHLSQQQILAVSHYQPLHSSPFYQPQHDGRLLPHATAHAQRLVRLPLYFELAADSQQRVIDAVHGFYASSLIR